MSTKRVSRAVVAVTAALLLGLAGLAMMKDDPAAAPASTATPRPVSIRLLGPAEVTTGMEVPGGLASQVGTYLTVEEPAEVTVRLPGDRTVRSWSKRTSVNVTHGVVVDVHLLPSPGSVPFREAVAELRRSLRAMSIEPDERMRKEIAGWPDDSDSLTYRAEMELGDGAALEVAVRPAGDGGYFPALTFAATVEMREVARILTRLANLPGGVTPGGPLNPGGQSGPGARTGAPLPEVSISVPGPSRRVRGMTLHEAAPTMWRYTPELLEPHRLTVRWADARQNTLAVRATVVLSSLGVVEGVYVRRPLEPVAYGEAVADLRRALNDLGVAPDGAVAGQMAAWPKARPWTVKASEDHDDRAVAPLSEQVRLDVRVLPDPRGGWYSLLMFGATAEACASAHAVERLTTLPTVTTQFSLRPGQPVEPAPDDARPEVSIPLLGPADRVRGMELGEAVYWLPVAWPDITRPCRLTVHLPDGRAPALDARGVALLSKRGTVTDVFARRPMEPVAYREAVADLRRAMDGLGVAPDEAMAAQMAAWPDDQPWAVAATEDHDVGAATRLGERVRLEVRVLPDPRGGWYSLLMFGGTAGPRSANFGAPRATPGGAGRGHQ